MLESAVDEWQTRVNCVNSPLEDDVLRSRNQGVSLEGKSIHTRKAVLVRKQNHVECFSDVSTV